MFHLRSIGLLLALMALYTGLGYVLFGWGGALLILAAGLAINAFSVGSAPRMILKLHRARRIAPGDSPVLFGHARALASRAGIPVPDLAVFPSDLPNAFALAGFGQPSTVAFSTGLLQNLSEREVSGVLAHEISHLKNRDTLLSLSAGLFVQSIAAVANTFGILMLLLFLMGGWPQSGAGLLTVMLLVGPAPYLAYALQAALMRTRERMADRDAALLTGDPQGLASALFKLERLNRYLAGLHRRFRFIYTTETGEGPEWLRTHPPTEERIRALQELDRKTARHPAAVYAPAENAHRFRVG